MKLGKITSIHCVEAGGSFYLNNCKNLFIIKNLKKLYLGESDTYCSRLALLDEIYSIIMAIFPSIYIYAA